MAVAVDTRRGCTPRRGAKGRMLAAALSATVLAAPLAHAGTPTGGANASTTGVFGPAIQWPLNGLHALILPSGKVMSYGTNEQGKQGGQFNYDVWDPALGTDISAHTVLPNVTAVDIFCSGQAIIPSTGEVLLTGGDETIDGKRNYSSRDTEIFSDQETNPQLKIRSESAMTYARWYPSLVTMPDGTQVAIGGRVDQAPAVAALTPERYTPGSGWHLLTGISADAIFDGNWYYPRTFVAPNGLIFMVAWDGSMLYLDPRGDGSITRSNVKTLSGTQTFPTLMYAPGELLSVRKDRKVVKIDLNGAAPVATVQPSTDQLRYWSNLTVMADGKVLLNGGSEANNELDNPSYVAQIWDPATEQWTTAAKATKPRLYHSIAILLPDGTVLTGAGGSPGPVVNLNAEIYYPPYLYKKDGSGQPAERPVFTTSWTTSKLGETRWVNIAPDSKGSVPKVSKVTLLRMGSVTHTYNSEQRYLEAQIGASSGARNFQITIPTNPNRTVPGYYIMFVFNQDGVPSVGKIIRLVV